MEQAEIYEYILTRIEADLTPFGYKRSGKGTLFYRYCADKRIACGIEMQKSGFNYPGSYSFTFNLACTAVFYFYPKPKALTLKHLKAHIGGLHGKRIGMLCRGRDYWWKITEEFLEEYGLAGYYDRFIQSDILTSAAYLDEQVKHKEKIFAANNEEE